MGLEPTTASVWDWQATIATPRVMIATNFLVARGLSTGLKPATRRLLSFNLIRRQPTDLTPLPTTHRVEVVLTSGKALQMLPKCPCKPDAGWLAKSSRQESNLQPTDYKTVALPVELQEHVQEICL